MEGLGAEVSAKIRSAIKAKLIELEAYVDDELPDYIMVMVANNRTKEQMEEDLGLFLNNNCGAFTNWLHAVLEKLKKVTLEEVTKKDSKKKKVKKLSEKSSKKSLKDGKDKLKESKEKDRKTKTEKQEKRTSRANKSVGEKKNANMEELGERKKKKAAALDDSGGKDGYNPASLLKSAIDKSKKKASPRKSSGKRTSKKEVRRINSNVDDGFEEESKPSRVKTMINLKEESDFYAAKRDKKEDLNFEIKRRGEREERSKISDRRERSRSYQDRMKRERSGSRDGRGGVASLVSKVVKPSRSSRMRSRSLSSVSDGGGYDPEVLLKRSLVSRAMVPPRPSRPAGREEKGVARAVNRAIMDADRSIIRSRRRDSREREPEIHPRDVDLRSRRRDDPRDRDIRWEGRERGYREREERVTYKDVDEWRRRERPERPPRLSPEDMERYEFLKRRHDQMEDRRLESEIRERRQRDRDMRDRKREENSRISKRVSSRGDDRSGRRLAMDEEIHKNVRASSLDRKLLKKRDERRGQGQGTEREEELRIIVRRDESIERNISPESPPRKRKLEDDDAELLEMRRKALESLMKRTDRELVRSRSNSRDRKLVHAAEASSDESDDSETTESDESDVSLSDIDEQEKSVKKDKSSKSEPTFIVTMDGIDDKYFKKANSGSQEESCQKKASDEKESHSKASSDAELELHADEDFDDVPKKMIDDKPIKKAVKKIKADNKKSEMPEKPTMKVAARKRSPVLPPADNQQTQPVAAVKPIQAAKPGPAAKPGSMSMPTTAKPSGAAKLAASYAAKFAAIKAAKAKAAANTEAVPKAPTSLSPAVRIKTVPAKSQQAQAAPDKPKVKRTPIKAPSPEPPTRSIPGISRLKSAPAGLSYAPIVHQTLPKSTQTCKYWPNCSRKDSCAFIHPPIPPKSAEPSFGNKYKWSAT